MTRLDPGPAPTLVTDWFTWAFVLACVAVFALVVLTVEILKAREDLSQDRFDAMYDLTFCDTHGHDVAADAAGWHCVNCGQVTRQPLNCGGAHRYEARGQSLLCSVCGHRTALPYNQTKESA